MKTRLLKKLRKSAERTYFVVDLPASKMYHICHSIRYVPYGKSRDSKDEGLITAIMVCKHLRRDFIKYCIEDAKLQRQDRLYKHRIY